MMQSLRALVYKEWLEAMRSYKLLWMPLLFIFLGISDPLTNYYMEDIFNAVGNMPEGFSMTFPDMTAETILLASTNQFQSIGLFVLVATTASMISRERQNGQGILLYVRPVSSTQIFLSKWIVASALAVFSSVAGYAASLYYTILLYGKVDAVDVLQMIVTYSLWLVVVCAICLLCSAAFSTAIAICVAIVCVPIGVMVDQLFGMYWHYSPYKLATYGAEFLTKTSTYFMATCMLSISILIVCLVLGIFFTKKNRQRVKSEADR